MCLFYVLLICLKIHSTGKRMARAEFDRMFARAAAHMYGSLLACACHLYLLTRRRVGRRLCLTKQRRAAVLCTTAGNAVARMWLSPSQCLDASLSSLTRSQVESHVQPCFPQGSRRSALKSKLAGLLRSFSMHGFGASYTMAP